MIGKTAFVWVLTQLFICQVEGLSVSSRPHVAVVGGGWAGWGAAKALCESGVKVTLLDALPDPTGKTPYLTKTGKPFEAGQRGFWYDYPNIASLLKDINVQEEDVFTDYLNSSFYSPFGLEATAPVFSYSSLPQLPSPLGQVFATFQLFERLPLSDRASMVGLLFAVLDMYRDEETFAAYDRMTAHELFIRMKLSKRLVDDFLRPTLLIGLFKSPEELSAAVVMELLYFYALAHQNSFDVRWMKKGTISGSIIAPLADHLVDKYNLTVLGSSRVETLHLGAPSESGSDSDSSAVHTKITGLRYKRGSKAKELKDLDGVVLALGAKGLKSVMSGSPDLAAISPRLSAASSLGSIDCISCRLWLDKKVPTRTPANVFSRFSALRGAGGTFFMLDQLHKDHLDELWGEKKNEDTKNSTDTEVKERGSVLAVDFYNAGGLMPLSDEEIVKTITTRLLPHCVKEFRDVKVVDSFVQKYAGAVSWFSPGSYPSRPRTTVEGVDNLFCAGDWVVMEGTAGENPPDKQCQQTQVQFQVGEHGAKGLCQERAYVSGLKAANLLLEKIHREQGTEKPKLAPILPVREDEPQVQLGRLVNRRVMGILKPIGLNSPWLR